MQQIINPQIPAQHLPSGWAYPNHAIQPSPSSPPVISRATVSPTATRVRWGRLVAVLAAITLIAFGVWNITSSGPDTDASKRPTVAGGGVPEDIDIARSARADAAAAITPPVVATPRVVPHRAAHPSSAGRLPAARRSATTPGTRAPTTAAGGGAGEALPLTGIDTWIAALLGIMLLGVGICVHVNAVRIGMTALLYRRGILLRPLDCARLAQSHAPARVRVGMSNLLHRLLEAPAGGGDFVSARPAR